MQAAPSKHSIGQWLQRPAVFFAIIGGYSLLHFMLRLGFSPVLGADDVDQAICSQSLALGCDLRQPPLYTWLQWLSNQVAGTGIFSIFLLKYSLLFLTYVFLYLIGRRLFQQNSTAALAALSLWLSYPFAVSVHQGVTHSLLLSLILAASFYALLKLESRRHWAGYLLLGALLGMGMLAKYSFGLYATALALAALSLPRYRAILLDPRILLTLTAGLLVVAPHGLWVWERMDAMHAALGGLGQHGAPAAYLPKVLAGLGSLASALLQFLFPLWLILLAFYPRAFLPRKAGPLPEPLKLLERTLLLGIALLALVVLAGGAVEIKARWMHVLLLLAPLYLFGRIELTSKGVLAGRGYLFTLFLLPVLVIGAWAGQTYLAPKQGKPTRFHAPYDRLAKQLIQNTGFERGTIVAGDLYLAGNMRIFFPQARVLTPAYGQYLPPGVQGDACMLMWEANSADDVPAALQAYLTRHGKTQAAGTPGHIQANYRNSETKALKLAYLKLPITNCP